MPFEIKYTGASVAAKLKPILEKELSELKKSEESGEMTVATAKRLYNLRKELRIIKRILRGVKSQSSDQSGDQSVKVSVRSPDEMREEEKRDKDRAEIAKVQQSFFFQCLSLRMLVKEAELQALANIQKKNISPEALALQQAVIKDNANDMVENIDLLLLPLAAIADKNPDEFAAEFNSDQDSYASAVKKIEGAKETFYVRKNNIAEQCLVGRLFEPGCGETYFNVDLDHDRAEPVEAQNVLKP